ASWLSSFMDRVDFMWPDAVSIWRDHGTLLVGRGLGGIGFAQQATEWWRYNAADNMMLYLFVTFGLLAILYVVVFLWGIARTFDADAQGAYFARCVRGWAVAMFSYGCTSCMVEQPMMNLVIGVCLGAGWSLWPRREGREASSQATPGVQPA